MKKLLAFLCCGLASFASVRAANIAFVSFHSGDSSPSAAAATAGFTQAPDVGYTQLLQANGHTVTRYVTADNFDTSVLSGADLVIISRSVASAHYQQANETAAWHGLNVPTIILGGYVLRGSRLGYTTGDTIPDVNTPQVRLRANLPGHPIFAGVALDSGGVMVNPYANLVSYTNTLQRGISVNTSPIAGGGVVIGSIGSAGDAALGGMVIAEWTPGSTMQTGGILAAHRLILLTGSRENAAFSTNAALTPEAAGIYDLEADGARLLLNAVNYMARSPGRRIVTVNTTNNDTPGATETSLLQALTGVQEGDYIRFAIPGAGPHTIVTPLGGYPLITANNVTIDGYSQPGSAPNSNPILGGNNAQIKIVLDSTGAGLHSTRLDFPNDPGNTGYGTSENCILGLYQSDNSTVRGLSFIARRSAGSDADPSIYAVALIREATNARVQGCWFGLAPGAGTTQADIKPPSSAVAAFRWRIGGDVYSAGAIIGTDGDGTGDRGEFNVIVGGRIALALELPGARIAGNYVNVFPSGLHFVDLDANYKAWQDTFEAGGSDPGDVTIENYENGRVTAGSVIGTNGDGVSDSDERNVFAHVIYDHHGEFYSSSANAVLAGNYFGVGVDGTTLAPLSTNGAPDFVEFGGGAGQVRVGSNGDGVSDDLEGNLIVNVRGSRFVVAGASVPVVSRRNKLVNCNVLVVPSSSADYTPYLADVSMGIAPVLKSLTGGTLSGTIPAPAAGYPNAEFDLYLVDPVALANTNYWPAVVTHPMTWLGTYTDNGPADLDADPNEFSIDVSGFALSDTTYVAAAASYSSIPGSFNATNAITTPMSNPISRRPALSISLVPLGNATLSWIAAPGAFQLQFIDNLNDMGWFPLGLGTYTGGRNVLDNPHDVFAAGIFFRLISQ
jgi:hypothetical protein